MKRLEIHFLGIKSFLVKGKDLRNIFWFLGSKIFFVILLLILLDILFGGMLLYKYAILAENQPPNSLNQGSKFNIAAYQEVSKKMEMRDKKFKEALGGDFDNPFKLKTIGTSRPTLK